ncbi:cupredoxin domain-containing protein [Vulgatibacter incomptus]|uniref:Lipoprotein n=1 Tax=Vulgatibacter incomptus TaxID=1391653 RepID=A0A0K1PC40_9BACT|nr:hypothetical protein [Vulgatibacter incomptus]AKU91090.1 hypothetical protein AKJ08_1477 [Vulgatibacter incomptus]
MRLFLVALLVLAASACDGPPQEQPLVQPSANAKPRGGLVISLNRVIMGRFRVVAPLCVGQRFLIELPSSQGPGAVTPAGGLPIRPGDTAEFRNFLPEVPTNVTSLSGPATLFSPNLVRPFNIATENTETFSFWRFTFPLAGAYEFFDTNSGSPGRPIVDSYYGTTSYVGETTAPTGVVCVDEPGCVASLDCLNGKAAPGTNCCKCVGVCCDVDEQCASGMSCHRGRCVDPANLD